MNKVDWEGWFLLILGLLIAAFAAIGIVLLTIGLWIIRIVSLNFKWILLAGVALILGSWYL